MIAPLPKNYNEQIEQLRLILGQARKIAVVVHSSPDGDAIGSSMAFKAVFEQLGKEVTVITPDRMLESLRVIPGAKEAVDAKKYPDFAAKLIAEADMIMCLDFNKLSRIDALGELVEKSRAKKALIDHHLDPDYFADVTISDPQACSTCFLLFKVLCALSLFEDINRQAAQALLAGMMTDTGNFSYNIADPDIFVATAELIRKGADKEKLYRALFDTHSLDAMRLNAYAIYEKMEVFEAQHAALICLSRDEINRFNYVKGDTEGLVNKPLAIPAIEYCAFLREEADYVKVSMRSLGDVPVNEMCADHFGGGGHKNAAGAEFKGSLDECADICRKFFRDNLSKYPYLLKKEK